MTCVIKIPRISDPSITEEVTYSDLGDIRSHDGTRTSLFRWGGKTFRNEFNVPLTDIEGANERRFQSDSAFLALYDLNLNAVDWSQAKIS